MLQWSAGMLGHRTVAEVLRENAQLKAENARLRAEKAEIDAMRTAMAGQIKNLKAELYRVAPRETDAERAPNAIERLRAAGELDVALAIAVAHRVALEDILSRWKQPKVAAARGELYRQLRTKEYSYPEIGKMFGVDHSSVIYWVKKLSHGKRA